MLYHGIYLSRVVRCLDFACKRCGVIIVVKQSQRYLMIVVEDQNRGLVLREEHTHPGKCLPLLLSFRFFFFCRFCKMLMNSTQVRWWTLSLSLLEFMCTNAVLLHFYTEALIRWIQSWVCGCSSKKAGTCHDLGFEALHLLFTVRRQVPRLVRKRGGHIGSSQQEDKEIQCPPEANCIDEYLGNQTVQEERGESVECLIRDMMELKLFPKLERRRRHLNQVFVRGDSVVMVQKLIWEFFCWGHGWLYTLLLHKSKEAFELFGKVAGGNWSTTLNPPKSTQSSRSGSKHSLGSQLWVCLILFEPNP